MHFQHAVQIHVIGVHVDGCAGGLAHAAQSDDVIDVCVGHHDGGYFQMMAGDYFQYSRRVVARIDYDGLAGLRVSYDVAIALQHSYGKDFVDQISRFGHTVQS